jgi:hypothetical protein
MLSGTKFLLSWAPQKGLVSTSGSTKYDPSYLMTESPFSENLYLKKHSTRANVQNNIDLYCNKPMSDTFIRNKNKLKFFPTRAERESLLANNNSSDQLLFYSRN